MSIVVEKAGILTTLQDGGRTGHRAFGINVNGPMDPAAAAIASILTGGDAPDAVLEMHYPAPVLRFEDDVTIAIAGADMGCRIDERALANWSSHNVVAGSTIRYTQKRSGNRAYLAVAGGFAVEPWLGSRSTNLAAGIGGFKGRRVQEGDRLDLSPSADRSPRKVLRASSSLIPRYSNFPTVRIMAGNEFDELSDAAKDALVSGTFAISQDANRMGFRLKGPAIESSGPAKPSSSVAFGTVQLLPDGQLIVLMADHQTSGGYPRVAHIITRDLPLIGQLGAGDKVAFHLITVDEAEQLAAHFARELNFLKVGCRLLKTT